MRIERTGLVHGTVHQRDLDVGMLAEERKKAKPRGMTGIQLLHSQSPDCCSSRHLIHDAATPT